MFVPEPGNIRVLVYQLDEEGRHVRHTADNVVGHQSVIGRRRNSEVNRHDAAGGAETGLAFDHVHERLFVRDRSRILVFDGRLDRFSDYPEATHVLGQPDFTTMETGDSRKHFPRGGELLIDDENQRLFVEDRTRILVFDIDPARLTNYPDAAVVIGQSDFGSREPGLGPNRLARTHGIAFDPDGKRLFVSDEGNQRVLVFDVDPDRLADGPDAVAVLGQPDFESDGRRFAGASARPDERRNVRSITPGGLAYDRVYERLFVSQLVDNRILVFDASPEELAKDADAIAVLGQPDFETFDPRVSRERFAFPKRPHRRRREAGALRLRGVSWWQSGDGFRYSPGEPQERDARHGCHRPSRRRGARRFRPSDGERSNRRTNLDHGARRRPRSGGPPFVGRRRVQQPGSRLSARWQQSCARAGGALGHRASQFRERPCRAFRLRDQRSPGSGVRCRGQTPLRRRRMERPGSRLRRRPGSLARGWGDTKPLSFWARQIS